MRTHRIHDRTHKGRQGESMINVIRLIDNSMAERVRGGSVVGEENDRDVTECNETRIVSLFLRDRVHTHTHCSHVQDTHMRGAQTGAVGIRKEGDACGYLRFAPLVPDFALVMARSPVEASTAKH